MFIIHFIYRGLQPYFLVKFIIYKVNFTPNSNIRGFKKPAHGPNISLSSVACVSWVQGLFENLINTIFI